MIVGVTGFFAAGKDTFAEILMRRGFRHVSLSDMIRAEILSRGEAITIPRLTATGNALRSEFGPQILAERALAELPESEDAGGHAVVTSIRHGSEVSALRARSDFLMVFVDAPIRVRHERSTSRAREGDPVSFEEFERTEREQMNSGDPNSQQLAVCKEMADRVVINDAGLEELERSVDQLLAE